MACLPESGKCERAKTDAFVDHLNALEQRAYTHERCLDVAIRDRAQPETLYRDADGSELVIERKNVLWPSDYAAYHHAEHDLFDLLSARICTSEKSAPYALAIPGRISLDRKILKRFAEKVAEGVLPIMEELAPGQGISSRVEGHPFRFWRQWEMERDELEPQTGLMIEVVQTPSGELDNPRCLPDGLQKDLEKMFISCTKKFAEYEGARRVLLIDPYGELRYLAESWWHEVLECVAPPPVIDEIWLGMRGILSESDEVWTFNRVHTALC